MYTVPQCSTSTNEYLSVFHSDRSAQTRSALACTVGLLVGSHLYCTGRLSPVLYCAADTSTVLFGSHQHCRLTHTSPHGKTH